MAFAGSVAAGCIRRCKRVVSLSRVFFSRLFEIINLNIGPRLSRMVAGLDNNMVTKV